MPSYTQDVSTAFRDLPHQPGATGCTECSGVNHSCLSRGKLEATGTVIATERETLQHAEFSEALHATAQSSQTSLWWPLKGFDLWKGKTVGLLYHCCSELHSGTTQEQDRLSAGGRVSWPSMTPRSPSPRDCPPQCSGCVERQGTACSCTPAILLLSKRISMPSCYAIAGLLLRPSRDPGNPGTGWGAAQIWTTALQAAGTQSVPAMWHSKINCMLGHNQQKTVEISPAGSLQWKHLEAALKVPSKL